MRFPFSRLQVVGKSMLPNLIPGQFLISFNWYPFDRLMVDDLVVVQVNNRLIIKRIKKINQSQIFVIGDNPKASTDSRQFGWINKSQIVGKVIFKYN